MGWGDWRDKREKETKPWDQDMSGIKEEYFFLFIVYEAKGADGCLFYFLFIFFYKMIFLRNIFMGAHKCEIQ